MMMLGEITEPQAVFSQLATYAGLWETTGPAFGPLLGSEVLLPRRPERWSLKALAVFKQSQSQLVRYNREEFERLWEGVYKARSHVFGDDYWLRRSDHLPDDLVRELEREWLALEPEVARYAIAKTRTGISPEAVLAGDKLYSACQALTKRGKGVDSLPNSVRGICRVELELKGSDWPFKNDGDYVMLPFGIMMVSAKKSLYIRSQYHDWFPGIEAEWLRIPSQHIAVTHLKEAVVGFVRELLKATATIGFTLDSQVSDLDMNSRPIIGIVQNVLPSFGEKVSVVAVEQDKLCTRHAVVPDCPKAMWKYSDAIELLADRVIEQWHQRSHFAGDDWERLALINLSQHAYLVRPLVADNPWFAGDDSALLAYAAEVNETVRDHVTVQDGRYVVTRHGLTSKLPLTTTDDATFAILLALAHHTDHKWSLGLVAGA